MTSHSARLYVVALALVVFFLAWATLAAHPWGAQGTDARAAALATREARLRQEAKLVNRVVAARWAAYRSKLEVRRSQIAAAHKITAPAPSVRVVTLPPLTITRSS
jgi:hypothetical protein